jgi:hypothetical protein
MNRNWTPPAQNNGRITPIDAALPRKAIDIAGY